MSTRKVVLYVTVDESLELTPGEMGDDVMEALANDKPLPAWVESVDSADVSLC